LLRRATLEPPLDRRGARALAPRGASERRKGVAGDKYLLNERSYGLGASPARKLGTPGTRVRSKSRRGRSCFDERRSSRHWTSEVRGRWPPEVRVRWPPEVRANERSTEGKGEAEASKALRWTECFDCETFVCAFLCSACTQTHTNAHKCTQTHTNAHKRTHAHTCAHKRTQTHTNAHMCTHAKNLTTFSEACWMNDRELSPLIKKINPIVAPVSVMCWPGAGLPDLPAFGKARPKSSQVRQDTKGDALLVF
jgi:hypothetical protein